VAEGRFGRATAAWDEHLGLVPGSTLRSRVSSLDPGASPELVLEATRASSVAEVRVALQIGLCSDLEREAVLVGEPLRPESGPIAFVFRRTAARDEPEALLAFVEVSSDPADAPRPEIVAESAARAAERRREITRSEEERREIADLLADLDDADERRARLVFLAGICGSPLALDVALIAGDTDLLEFADAVRAALPEARDRAASAWPVERAAWMLLGRKASEGTIAPELAGVLARQGGEAARFPGAIEDLVRGIADVDGLERQLVEENRILLEDASPSARSRAYDWLAARGEAPAGFDPFAPLAERRAALRRAEEARSAGTPTPR
jgi:hypothetical protein